ncbi:MAG TPA: hypothetical protein PLK99_04470, partial [Burkholderiales bacterium]|nr:hypothetical protein [Burkholderiales bacterium]
MKSAKLRGIGVLMAAFAIAGVARNAAAAAPTGTCGLVASMPHPELDWYAYAKANGPTITKNMDLLAEINFSAGTIDFSVTQFTWTTGGSAITKATIAGHTSFTMTGPGSSTGASTPGTGNSTPNAYQISFVAGSS